MPSQLSFLSNLPVAKFLFLCAEIFLLHLLQHSTIHCSPRGEGNSVGRILNLSRQLVANRQLILGQYTDPPPPRVRRQNPTTSLWEVTRAGPVLWLCPTVVCLSQNASRLDDFLWKWANHECLGAGWSLVGSGRLSQRGLQKMCFDEHDSVQRWERPRRCRLARAVAVTRVENSRGCVRPIGLTQERAWQSLWCSVCVSVLTVGMGRGGGWSCYIYLPWPPPKYCHSHSIATANHSITLAGATILSWAHDPDCQHTIACDTIEEGSLNHWVPTHTLQ